MTRLLCCLRARADMGAAISHPQEGEACDGGVPASPPTMADVIRERKKKAGGAGLGTLRRRIAAAARRPRDSRPDRGCEHARFIRSVVSSWRLCEVFQLCEELEAGAALRDLATQAELAREPAPALHADLARMYAHRWFCDVEVVGSGWSLLAHRVVLSARCSYFRDLLQRYPSGGACGVVRVPLEGAGAALARADVEAALLAIYAVPCTHCDKWERGLSSDVDLDIISVENTSTRRCTCAAAALLGVSAAGALCGQLRRALDGRGDAALLWPAGAELRCHRLLLAARSRSFRNILSRRGAGGVGGTVVCVDEKVLPRRFARALLHAAYTDQVDLSLIGRSSSSPSATNGGSGSLRGSSRGTSISMLDDAFQLYEIARFLEMPIVAQGCEDAVARALAPDTLPHVLRWAAAPHASAWLHRQAMRYLLDEFPTVMASPAAARLPRAALQAALASPFLQASESQALRGVLRWAERAVQPLPQQQPVSNEPNLVWHTSHGRRAARRRRAPPDAAVRAALADLAPLLRLEHLPPDCDALAQATRRGLLPPTAPAPPPDAAPVPPAAPPTAPRAVDAWLGRGSCRPPRCFLPYLDELRALLQDQAPSARRVGVAAAGAAGAGGAGAGGGRGRIPDTLYMVAAAAAAWGEACVPPRVLRALRLRARELRATPAAQRALALHALDTREVRRQIALRAVREMSLPDSCAELLLNDADADSDVPRRESSGEWERANTSRPDIDDDCCRSGSGSIRCPSGATSTHNSLGAEQPRASRRDLTPRHDTHSRSSSYSRARLSAAVPDVAMAPNANTHLLTARDYPHAHPQHPQHLQHPHSQQQPLHALHSELGGVLQLDLGDGATHTPRPGSRAQRARQHREHSQGMSCSRREDDELRAAIELSVIRAYSSLQVARRPHADLLPPPEFSGARTRATPSPSALTAARPHLSAGAGSPSPRRSPRALYAVYHPDLSREGTYGRQSRSRGASPHT